MLLCSSTVTAHVGSHHEFRKKKDRNHGKGMAAYIAVEPDMLAVQAPREQRVEHAAAVFIETSHSRINNKYKEGIDVSHYQGSIDWDEVVNNTPISYAYLKATEGASLVDKTYARNLSEARRVGLSVGSYHFTDRTLIGNNNSRT